MISQLFDRSERLSKRVIERFGAAFPERNLRACALFLLVLCLPLFILIQGDARTVHGVSVWLKPFKFSLSLGVMLGTLSWSWHWLAARSRDGWVASILVRLLIGMSLFEVGYIASRAAVGEDSHFNLATPYSAFMFRLMGIGSVTLVTILLILGIMVLKSQSATRNPAMRQAVGLGLVFSGVIGLVTGVILVANAGALVGTPESQANIIPLFGWSRDVGDLRIPHFLGLHAMQILPIVAWLTKSSPHQIMIINVAAISIAVMSALALTLAAQGYAIL
ncbi:MAG: hypothetical protein O9315_17470 [Beijerinckiaceae bacterium]|nr:hypothetical protein [Brevundimonas sp.]MCZ8302035.1 hypothetical protein [Beijerinckiaceae bacterium]